MRIAVPKEITPGEKRVVFTPDSVTRLVKSGFEVVVEKGAGVSAIYPDSDYVNAGATIEDNVEALLGGADLVIKVQGPAKNDAKSTR
jgi:NAD(P) transhydrogenase subunit alpha